MSHSFLRHILEFDQLAPGGKNVSNALKIGSLKFPVKKNTSINDSVPPLLLSLLTSFLLFPAAHFIRQSLAEAIRSPNPYSVFCLLAAYDAPLPELQKLNEAKGEVW